MGWLLVFRQLISSDMKAPSSDPALPRSHPSPPPCASASAPPPCRAKIVQGRLDKLAKDMALLEQPFIKDTSKTVGEVIMQSVASIGENIQVGVCGRDGLRVCAGVAAGSRSWLAWPSVSALCGVA